MALIGVDLGTALETLLRDRGVDWAISFAFLTALVFSVFSRRFGDGRATAAMAASLGLALSFGVVSWESRTGWSVRDLGPAAVVFMLLVLAGALYQGLQTIGGVWAGLGIALGLSLLVGVWLGVQWFFAQDVLVLLAIAALVLGVCAWIIRRRRDRSTDSPEIQTIRHDMADIKEDRTVAEQIRSRLRLMERSGADTPGTSGAPGGRSSRFLTDTPTMLLGQLRDVLPQEGWLAKRMSELTQRIEALKRGHWARIEQLHAGLKNLPAGARRAALRELQLRLRQSRLDYHIEQLEKLVAEHERHIADLTLQATQLIERRDYEHWPQVLHHARKLQRHANRLLKSIERMEAKLLRYAREATRLR